MVPVMVVMEMMVIMIATLMMNVDDNVDNDVT